jgi:2-polyprenyl-3-methyl-5-hydroxy-6-metoxy-1,4-benzoquinol methylase
MDSKIFHYLKQLNLTSESTRSLFNIGTRDIEDLKVWRDEVSGVIFIDDFYTGNDTYIDGSYREDKVLLQSEKPAFERISDANRRFNDNLKYVAGKKVADFGCGSGNFLRLVSPYCEDVKGVELQQNYVDSLNADGIHCVNDLDKIKDKSVDVFLSFHVIEHLPNPIETLSQIIKKTVSGGTVLIEVPHANDFLLSVVSNEPFKKFTLWSQHLVLHTRESLLRTLKFVGLEDIQIEGGQRYPLSNKLHWLANGKAGGHKSPLSVIDSKLLSDAYESSLARIDATDTLVAIAKVP